MFTELKGGLNCRQFTYPLYNHARKNARILKWILDKLCFLFSSIIFHLQLPPALPSSGLTPDVLQETHSSSQLPPSFLLDPQLQGNKLFDLSLSPNQVDMSCLKKVHLVRFIKHIFGNLSKLGNKHDQIKAGLAIWIQLQIQKYLVVWLLVMQWL